MADKKITILLAPLDWGLGHSTRCIPLIRYLMAMNCNVILACNSKQKEMLLAEFPGLASTQLEGYQLRYGKSRIGTLLRIIAQIPKILTKIKYERNWLRDYVRRQPVDLIISDNRFGLSLAPVPSVFITHQLHIKTGLGGWVDNWVQRLNYRYIRRFSECWIPDYAGTENLAGELSHPRLYPPVPCKYLGALSRFKPCENAADEIPLLIILSGPEPQRSILESHLLKQLAGLSLKTVLVRGVPGEEQLPRTGDHVQVLNYATAGKLNRLLCAAKMVICRSGYTSIMDILKLRKKSIMIPTPGQAEQAYLGQRIKEQNLALVLSQANLRLEEALRQAAQFRYRFIPAAESHYEQIVSELLAGLSASGQPA